MNALRTTWTTGCILLLVFASEANSGPIAALPEDSRVFYVFSHDKVPQRERVLQVWQQVEQRLVAIARDEHALAVEGLTVWSVAKAAESAAVPAYIKARLDADGDYFAAMDAAGTLYWAGPGRDLLQSVATEVDESTWGKVKDLFK